MITVCEALPSNWLSDNNSCVMDYALNSSPTPDHTVTLRLPHSRSPTCKEIKEKKQSVTPQQSIFSLNTFYFYYKYSSVVTKQSICHEDTAKHKECSAHKTGFVHNMWSGMLVIAGSETARAQPRLSPLISHLYTHGKHREGQRWNPGNGDPVIWLVNASVGYVWSIYSDFFPLSTLLHRWIT